MLYLFLSTICFSLSFGLIKNQLTSVPSDLVVFLRLFLAGLIFLPFFKKVSFKKYLIASGIGIIQFGLMYMFFIRSFKYLQGNEIALLTTSTPLWVAVCSLFLGERFRWSYIACILLSVLGATVVIWNNTNFAFLVAGVLLMELCNFCFALGQVLWRKYIGGCDTSLMIFAYLASAVFVLPFLLINVDLQSVKLTSSQWLSIIYLGIIPTGIGFWLWNKGVRLVSSTILAVMNNLKIPMGVLFALILFHEKINVYNFLIGAAIILISILLGYFVTGRKN